MSQIFFLWSINFFVFRIKKFTLNYSAYFFHGFFLVKPRNGKRFWIIESRNTWNLSAKFTWNEKNKIKIIKKNNKINEKKKRMEDGKWEKLADQKVLQ